MYIILHNNYLLHIIIIIIILYIIIYNKYILNIIYLFINLCCCLKAWDCCFHLCESVLWSCASAGLPRSKCCSRTCWRNSDTWYCRSSFSCRSLRCRASHRSSSWVLWAFSAPGSPAPTEPGPRYRPWLEIRPGTWWWGGTMDEWSPGGTGLGAGRAGSLVLSADKKRVKTKMSWRWKLGYMF